MPRHSIVALMSVAEEHHDVDWLKHALQAAVTLELATLPPYLCAYWSISQGGSEAGHLIRSIYMEEMLHMGLACNMLTAIGGQPKTTNTTPEDNYVPTYPGPLPGGVRPGLEVYLAGLSKQIVHDVFMEIEYPEGGPVARAATQYTTIGAFYSAIADAFRALPPGAIKGERQIDGYLGLFAVTSVEDAEKAIETIKEQGEGTSQSPEVPDEDELAHYYKFAEIWHGRRLIQNDEKKWVYEGEPVPFPPVFPVARVPAGGYPEESRDFDALYSALLRQIEETWTTSLDLGPAIGTMYDLRGPARELMQTPRSEGGGNYCPSFLWKPA